MSAAPQSNESQERLQIEKISDGDITCVRFEGLIDEAFEGRRLASSIRSKILIIHMGRVSKISSFGIREWSDFIKGAERVIEHIYLIECTVKVVDQVNMVAGFLGKARLVSFYGPYRCDYCDIDEDVLFQVDRDSAAIRSFDPPKHVCETCARPQFFDEDPASFFSSVAQQPQFDLAPGVPEFLSSKLAYSVTGGNRRLQIDKYVEGRSTYVRISGNLDGSFSSEKVAEGLEGVVVVDVSGLGAVDIAGAAEWRNFITLARQGVDRICLVGCPPILMDRVPKVEDLGDQVLTFSMPYTCAACSTTSSQTVDVSEHYEILRFATPPEMKCQTCKQPTVCAAQESLLSRLRSLPKPDVDAKLRSFIKTAEKRKPEQHALEAEVPAGGIGGRRLAGILGAATAGLVAAAGFMLYYSSQQSEAQEQISETQKKLEEAQQVIKKIADRKSEEKPSWITSDTTFAGYCVDNVTQMSCVGISSYLPTRQEAEDEARIVAFEELVTAIGIKINAPFFEEQVRPLYARLVARPCAAMKRSWQTRLPARATSRPTSVCEMLASA